MQYVRCYIGPGGVIEHVETQSQPLPEKPGIVVHELDIPEGQVIADRDLVTYPRRQRTFDIVEMILEPNDGRFKRAREVMDSVEVRPSDLRISVKGAAERKFSGTITNAVVKRATRGQQ